MYRAMRFTSLFRSDTRKIERHPNILDEQLLGQPDKMSQTLIVDRFHLNDNGNTELATIIANNL